MCVKCVFKACVELSVESEFDNLNGVILTSCLAAFDVTQTCLDNREFCKMCVRVVC